MLAAPDVSTRRHDLDALRAGAMLAGVAFHAAHSFAPGMPWLIHDTQQSPWWFLFLFLVHGCRMPLFFLVSGYFTALLFERKGLSDLLRHRLARIGGPLVAAIHAAREVPPTVVAAGLRPGLTCSDGIYVDGRRIDTGDCSGPKSARAVPSRLVRRSRCTSRVCRRSGSATVAGIPV